MMGAVDGEFRSVELGKEAVGHAMAVVGLVVFNPLMGLKLGDVLTDLSPERYVNQLVAFAYAQNWLSGIQKSVQNFDLAAIPFRLDFPASVDFFSEQGGVNIGSAGENQRVVAGKSVSWSTSLPSAPRAFSAAIKLAAPSGVPAMAT